MGGRGRGYTGRHHLREEPHHLAEIDNVAPLAPHTATEKVYKKLTDIKMRSPDPIPKHEESVDREFEGNTEEKSLQDLLYVDEQYKPLLVLLEQFSPGEDGIVFNRKLRHFEKTITTMCPDESTLLLAFSAFRAAALADTNMARKLATVGASFTRQPRLQSLRKPLLNVMQETFANIEVLQRSNPKYLSNAANLLGDYFAEARLSNGSKIHVLAAPLLEYLKAMLGCNDMWAHKSLAAQLMQNGRELLAVLSKDLDELLIAIKLKLLSRPPVNIVWLLLSADLCLNKFLPLPNVLQQFYASQLTQEDFAPASQPSYSEVNYGSWKRSPEKDNHVPSSPTPEIPKELDVSTEKLNQSVTQLNVTDDSVDSKPKLRPILGAGAAMQREVKGVNQDSMEPWAHPKSSLAKRYDLNSWRENGEDQELEVEAPVFNPSVMPPPIPTAYQPIIVPDYPPPPIIPQTIPPTETYIPQHFLQQGDSKFIQNQETFSQSNTSFSQGDGLYIQPQEYQEYTAPEIPTNTQNENSKALSNDQSRKQVENWRKEGAEVAESKGRQKVWSRQKSRENIEVEEKTERPARSNSKSSKEPRQSNRNIKKKDDPPEQPKPRRHVTDVPRSQKYWDHDDRCDKDY